jgi:cytochrome c|tara:strand:+ start:165 stop:614 length:450 start_codon:yes stop_codon:yes gene_type:complete
MSKKKASWMVYLIYIGLLPIIGEGSDLQILEPRVPADQIGEVRTWTNPFTSTPQNIEKGKALFESKAYCVTCHGKNGEGYDHIPGLRGKLPRNFTDKSWQAVRTDGELMWILKNGSVGTAMVQFIPLTLTEDEAWHVILYIRTFGKPKN